MIDNYPSPEVKAFGEQVMSALFDANIRKCMAGLGGCPDFKWEDFDASLHPFIKAYLEDGCDSVAICYAAMRTKEKELT